MEGVRAYLLSVCASAILCGVVLRLLGKKDAPAAVGKMVCGVFLTLAVLQPLARLRPGLWENLSFDAEQAAQQAVQQGQAESKKALEKIIKDKAEAYILEKAGQLSASVTVEVSVGGDSIPVPQSVRLDGAVTPYAKSRLQTIISEELGISKENQIWTSAAH